MEEDRAAAYGERLHWLVRLRWWFVAALFALTLVLMRLTEVQLNASALQVLALITGAYNLAFRQWQRAVIRSDRENRRAALRAQAAFQVTADIIVVGAVIHFTGGGSSPFVFLLVLPLIVGGMLLRRQYAYLQVAVALAIYGAVLILEGSGVLHHYSTDNLWTARLSEAPLYLLYVGLVFVVLVATMYLTDTQANQLRHREAQLRETTAELEKQAEECRAAYVKLKRAQRRQLAYMRKVAHELKSPISAITMMLQAIEDSLGSQIPEKQAEMLHRTTERGEGALELTEDLLRLSELQSSLSSEETTQINITHVIENIVEEREMMAEEAGISLSTEIDEGIPPIIGYEAELRDMLDNLISNAIKYTPEGGEVEIAAHPKQGNIVLRVSDDGIGISAEDIDRIFDEFYRASSARDAGIDGTGLGLSIVKSVVEHHGGRIDVESETGEGTTFELALPIDPSGAVKKQKDDADQYLDEVTD